MQELTPRELKSLTVADLIDLHGDTKRRLDKIEDRFDRVRKEILRRGFDHAEGAEFETSVTRAWRTTVSVERLRNEFGEKWVAKRSIKTPYDMVTTIPRKRKTAPAPTNGARKSRKS